ncbi:MAG TPA: hypothetical protein VF593_02975, partial [Chthoniobacteraceae bacterium]
MKLPNFLAALILALAVNLCSATSQAAEPLRVLSSPATAQFLAAMATTLKDAGVEFKVTAEVG